MKLEFVIGFLSNLQNGFIAAFAISTIIIGIFVVIGVSGIMAGAIELADVKKLKSAGQKLAIVWAISGLFASIPSVDSLYKTRIALLKYSLAAPENVKSGAETIERIAKKLECKYLGCEEEKK